MRVVAPFAAGNKDSLLQRLLIVANIHEKALAAGLPIVDVQDSYNLALEIGKAADLPATKFFTDPATIPPKEPEPNPTMIALEIENKKVEQQAEDSQTDAGVDKYKADLDAEVKRFQTEANATLQITLAQIKAGQQVDLERVRAKLKAIHPELVDLEDTSVLDSITDTLSQINQAINTERGSKKIIRENGRIAGVERSDGSTSQVLRDGQGSIVGVE